MSIPNIAAITFMNNLSGSVFPVFDFIIIDFGSKGLQASLFRLQAKQELQALSHAFTCKMSGEVIDDILVKHFEPFIKEAWENKPNESTPEMKNKMLMRTLQNLRKTVRTMKTQTNIDSDIVGPVTLIPFDEDIEVKMSQSDFESLVRKDLKHWVQLTLETAIDKVPKQFGDLNIQYVRWTGGSSLLPLFQNIVKEFFTQQGTFYPFYQSSIFHLYILFYFCYFSVSLL